MKAKKLIIAALLCLVLACGTLVCVVAESPNEAVEAQDAYIVYIVDGDGNPVPGAALNFCTDTTCELAMADENGVVVFEGEPFAYHVAVLKLPEGYSLESDEEIYTQPLYGSLTIVVHKD